MVSPLNLARILYFPCFPLSLIAFLFLEENNKGLFQKENTYIGLGKQIPRTEWYKTGVHEGYKGGAGGPTEVSPTVFI